MRQHIAASFVLACASIIAVSHNALAQSPPPAEPDVVIWSDQDLSLRPGGFAQTETETDLRWPHIVFPGGSFGGDHGRLLMCEPGQPNFVESAAAAYAQIVKQQTEQAR